MKADRSLSGNNDCEDNYSIGSKSATSANKKSSCHSESSTQTVERSKAKWVVKKGLKLISPPLQHFRSRSTDKKPQHELSTTSDVVIQQYDSDLRTADTIEKAVNYLNKEDRDNARRESKAQSVREGESISQSSESRASRRRFGIAPWHKRTSYSSTWSVTSSIRALLRGPTPPGSPALDHEKLDGDERKGKRASELSTREANEYSERLDTGEGGEPTFLTSVSETNCYSKGIISLAHNHAKIVPGSTTRPNAPTNQECA